MPVGVEVGVAVGASGVAVGLAVGVSDGTSGVAVDVGVALGVGSAGASMQVPVIRSQTSPDAQLSLLHTCSEQSSPRKPNAQTQAPSTHQPLLLQLLGQSKEAQYACTSVGQVKTPDT
mmetsp:Transcript_42997/g.108824  ORF Transcript_42997/g.108824 Transcript_42997/m.108824 type:complete len:118 (+) Transcript_42997:1919-2272(+)